MSKLRKSVVSLLYEIGNRSGCHQLPQRSFFLNGRQFPVCARCTGVAFGQLAAILLNLCISIPALVSALFLAVMGLDWGLQETGIKVSSNFRRLFTGLLGGFGLFNLYIICIKKCWKFAKRSFL